MNTQLIRWARCSAIVMVIASAAASSRLSAQGTGTIEGTVSGGEAGLSLSGARVAVAGTRLGAFTDEAGRFRIAAVPAGTADLVTEYIGRRVSRQSVEVVAGRTVVVAIRLDVEAIPAGELVITASRETARRSETPASVGVITEETLREVKPAHPSEIMNRIAGVWVNVTGGEGHMAAIRQPLTTNPVYLYAEDGVPSRSTGFFNHNALYEIDVPDAERIEVVKGPATALYGSDAIGGTINVVTRSPFDGVGLSVEGGAFGFGRLLASAGHVSDTNGLLAQLNVTRTDGWRDGTAYNRESGTLTWNRDLGQGSRVRTVATFSRIDQNTAGSSSISSADYLDRPQINYTPISYRRIKAFRLHSAIERLGESSLLSVTPFLRWNEMDILPNWSLTFDPGIWNTGNASAGALVKYRRDFQPMNARVIAGADFDYSPGHHFEKQIAPVRDGKIFESYTEGATIYDYDVSFLQASPYVQAEISPVDRLRVTGGLRFDALGFDYSNKLDTETTGRYRRPASTTVNYAHLSPKLGATFALSNQVNAYGAYGHGFRAPSEGQLFRQGRAENTIGLQPVKANNVEVGIRSLSRGGVSFEAATYRMTKDDDILGLTNTDGSTQTANAGRTLHRGIEIGAGAPLPAHLRIDVSYSLTSHTYEDWKPSATVDYSGNDMESAPRDLGNASLSWRPPFLGGSVFAFEWQRVGRYWMDAENTHRYPGHDLFNVRINAPVTRNATIFARLMNLTNERYAENSGYTAARGEEFAPGMPRSLYIGLQYR